MASAHWWHLYRGECEHVTVSLMLGESTEHPEALAAKRKLNLTGLLSGALVCCEDTPVLYVRSWDHEPTELELEAV